MRSLDIMTAPDETVFGIAARQHRLSGNRSSNDSLLELFGSDRVIPASLLPGHLGRLFDYLGMADRSPYSSIVDRHTVLPYWRLFVPVDRYGAVQSSMWLTAATGLKLSLGLISSRLGGASTLRYCDGCAEADLANLGVATWHRIHQLPGVLMCPNHVLALNECHHLSQHIHRHTLFLPDERLVPFNRPAHDLPEATKAQLVRLASLGTELLNSPSETALQALALRERYLVWLGNYGLLTSGKRVCIVALQRHGMNYWEPVSGTEPFATLVASIRDDHSWLTTLVRKQRAIHHPLKHLLLIGSLAPSVNAFLYERVSTSAPSGVWRQPAALNDSSVVADALRLMESEGYSARHTAHELSVGIHTILTIAHRHGVRVARRSKRVFAAQRDAIRLLLRKGTPLAETAHRLGISASTASRVLAEDCDLQRVRRKVQRSLRRDESRHCMIAALENHPIPSPSELRRRIPACYMWLYRNDHAWLIERLLDLPPATRAPKSCVDWNMRDAHLAKAIRSTVQAIRVSEEAPVRITLRELGRRTGHVSWLEKHRAKLPICNILLEDVLESVPEFQARRLEWWNQQLTNEEGISPPPSRLRRLAGIPSRHRVYDVGNRVPH